MVALIDKIDLGHDQLVFSYLYSLCYHGHWSIMFVFLKLLCNSFTDAEREIGDYLLGKLLTSWRLPNLSYIVSEVKSFRRIHPIVLGTIKTNYTMGWSSQSFGYPLPTPHTNSFTRHLFLNKNCPVVSVAVLSPAVHCGDGLRYLEKYVF